MRLRHETHEQYARRVAAESPGQYTFVEESRFGDWVLITDDGYVADRGCYHIEGAPLEVEQ